MYSFSYLEPVCCSMSPYLFTNDSSIPCEITDPYLCIFWASSVAQTVKNPFAMIHGSGRSPGETNGYPFQYSCLENSTDKGACQATVHGVAKSWTRLRDFTFTYFIGLFWKFSKISPMRQWPKGVAQIKCPISVSC